MSKKYSVPISWESYKRYEVEADNLQEAVDKALRQFLSEPDNTYLDNSFSIDGIIHDENPNESFDLNKITENL